MRKALSFATAAVLLLTTSILSCAQDDRTELLKMQGLNVRLQRQVDSLQALLDASKGATVPVTSRGEAFSSWDRSAVQVTTVDGVFSMWDRLLEEYEIESETVSVEERKKTIALLPDHLDIGTGETVQKYIDFYNIRRKSQMEKISKRYHKYEEYITGVFRDYGVPEEICTLCIVESACNPYAVSKAGATGFWQFMPATARTMGLTVNDTRDDRLDIEKSTVAAAKLLSRGYQILGDWRLAVCSYNCGIGAVQTAIRKNQGRKDFWDVIQYLPEETKAYMPSLVAVWYYIANEETEDNS